MGALNKFEEYYSFLFEIAPDAIMLIDPETGSILDANHKSTEMFGVSHAELCQLHVRDFYHPDQPDHRSCEESFGEHAALALAGIEQVYHRHFVTQDGKNIFCEVRVARFPFEKRKLLRVSLIDITDRLREEEALKESEAKLRALFNSSRDAIGVAKDGIHLFANPAYLELFGYQSSKELIGTVVLNCIAPSHRKIMLENIRRRTAKEVAPDFYESRGLKSDGTEFPLEINIGTYELHGEVYTVASIRDITSRKHEEKMLKESEARLSSFFEGAPLGMFRSTLDGHLLHVNRALATMFGYESSDEMIRLVNPPGIAKVLWESSEERSAIIEKVKAAMGSYCQQEFRMSRRDGTSLIAVISVALTHDSSWPEAYLSGFIQDITERKTAEVELLKAKEAAEKALAIKSRFLDIAAHELRTPVTVFSVTLQLAEKQLEKGQSVEPSILRRLRGQADRLSHLVVDLLDVTRITRGLVVLNCSRIDLVSLIMECLDDFKIQAPTRRFIFRNPEHSIEVTVDPLRIRQVLSNFIDNAIKYTPEDSSIEVMIESMPEKLRVSVKDNGAGFSVEQQQELFKPFTRGSSDREVRTSGLGLGLSICRGIIELHGGSIGVVSKIGEGSTFYFDLPREGIQI